MFNAQQQSFRVGAICFEFRAISACIAHNVVEFVLLGFGVVAMVPLKAECTQRGLNP